MAKSKVEIQNLQPYLLIVVGLLFVLLDKSGFSKWVRYPLSYAFEPVSFIADGAGSKVSEWGYALTDASSYISELNLLKEEVIKARSSQAGNILLQEENAALKQQMSFSTAKESYVIGKVLSYSSEGFIRINVGRTNGVEEGDVVQIGKFFVGVVSQVDELGSLVRLPLNKSSHYEVVILPKDTEIRPDNPINDVIKATGVISGSVSGIKLENVSLNAEVADGDLVILRDERIGDTLVLGNVVGLIVNPASTSKSGFVSPVFDYANLITVFVNIK